MCCLFSAVIRYPGHQKLFLYFKKIIRTILGRLWKLCALTNLGRWKIAGFNGFMGVEKINVEK